MEGAGSSVPRSLHDPHSLSLASHVIDGAPHLPEVEATGFTHGEASSPEVPRTSDASRIPTACSGMLHLFRDDSREGEGDSEGLGATSPQPLKRILPPPAGADLWQRKLTQGRGPSVGGR